MTDEFVENKNTKNLVAKYDKKPNRGLTLIKETEQAVLKTYTNSYNAITVKLQKAFRADDWFTIARQRVIMEDVLVTINKLNHDLNRHYEKALADSNRIATEEGVKDTTALFASTDKTYREHLKINKSFTNSMLADMMDHVAGRTKNMETEIKFLLRRASQEVFRRASIEGLTRKATARLLSKEVAVKIPNFQFVDRAGRRWDNSTYFEMLTRTVLSNALNQNYTNTLANEGHDLVKVSYNAATDPCRNWEGKILSLTGATEGYTKVGVATGTGEVFHPRCRHRLIAYHPDLEQFMEEN